MKHQMIAAVDLGSNSFRLQVGRCVNDQIYPLDGLKEPVRLAAGLTPDKFLDEAAQQRAIAALLRFNERLRGFEPDGVRAVGTNTLRVAKNAPEFLVRAEAALGFPIEVIAGREEARLIYVGVAHSQANPHLQQLVVDIGGGSTEFIIGKSFKPLQLESLYMGCVSFSLRYFPGGAVDKRSFKEAELAARRELQAIAFRYRETGWEVALGSSGSAKALADVLGQNGFTDGTITRAGLEAFRNALIKGGNINSLDLAALRSDRTPVVPGGLAIMSAVFKEFGLESMAYSEGALRLGVLYDLLGRYHHHDLRVATVRAFMQRYGVDREHAARVADTALHLLMQVFPEIDTDESAEHQFLNWAAQLHEVGISVAHSSYHKHSAYILANADMPGFSRMDQGRLARLVLSHRGKLERIVGLDPASPDWVLIACMRLAHVLNRARDSRETPPATLAVTPGSMGAELVVGLPAAWLDEHPLTAATLGDETQQWASVGRRLTVESGRRKAAA
jgi:exopolyphosphatase/guanosine-5'-triphosphate,3'-diphosphate pyrophosphatase